MFQKKFRSTHKKKHSTLLNTKRHLNVFSLLLFVEVVKVLNSEVKVGDFLSMLKPLRPLLPSLLVTRCHCRPAAADTITVMTQQLPSTDAAAACGLQRNTGGRPATRVQPQQKTPEWRHFVTLWEAPDVVGSLRRRLCVASRSKTFINTQRGEVVSPKKRQPLRRFTVLFYLHINNSFLKKKKILFFF